MTIAIIIAAIGWGLAFYRHWDAVDLRKLLNAEVQSNDRYLATNTALRQKIAALTAAKQPRDARGRFGSKPSIKQEVR